MFLELLTTQGLEKGAILCFRNPNFYFGHGESTSTASQKSKDLNKVSLLLQDLVTTYLFECWSRDAIASTKIIINEYQWIDQVFVELLTTRLFEG